MTTTEARARIEKLSARYAERRAWMVEALSEGRESFAERCVMQMDGISDQIDDIVEADAELLAERKANLAAVLLALGRKLRK